MYETVLGINFGDISWLFRAIRLRHDCVHRAGYDQDGKVINLSKETIEDLLYKIEDLTNSVEAKILDIDIPF